MKKINIEGKQVILRNLCVEDLKGNYLKWLNDSNVARYNSHHRFPMTLDKAKDYVSKIDGINIIVMAIIDKESHAHIGNVSLQNISIDNRSAELAIMIGETITYGKGVGKEACRLLCHYGFDELKLNRIYCGTSEKNTGMKKIAEFLKMKLEVIKKSSLFKKGKFETINIYGVLNDEFYKK